MTTSTTSMLDREFKFYIQNQKELAEKHFNKFLVIIGQEVVGVYNSHAAAYDAAVAEHELGTFLIQHCLPGQDSYSQTFHSRVYLNQR